MNEDFESVIYTEREIKERTAELAARITADYKHKKNIVMVCILKGSAIFFADIVRQIELRMTLDFMAISSYGMTAKSTGEVSVTKDVSVSVTDKDVIIVEDIIDTGLTLKYIVNSILLKKPASVKVCAMFDKPSRRKTDIVGDYVGLVVPDKFVVGYGLDYAERYRNLPYLAALKNEIYNKRCVDFGKEEK